MIHELSSVKTKDGCIWLIHGKLNGDFVCRPKYYLKNGKYIRLYSPIFNMKAVSVLSKYRRYDYSGAYQGLFLLDRDEIVFAERKNFLDNISVSSKTGKVALRAYNALVQSGIKNSRLGFAGSLIWGTEIDGLSDINFVIMGDESFKQYLDVCETIPGFRFRSPDEWREFYHRFCVVGVEEDMFVKKSCANHQQGFIYEVPFTVFHIREKLPVYETMIKKSEHVSLCGEYISDQSSWGYYPLIGTFKPHGSLETYRIMIWNRFYSTFFPNHSIVEVEGIKNGNQIIVAPTNRIKTVKELL